MTAADRAAGNSSVATTSGSEKREIEPDKANLLLVGIDKGPGAAHAPASTITRDLSGAPENRLIPWVRMAAQGGVDGAHDHAESPRSNDASGGSEQRRPVRRRPVVSAVYSELRA